MTETPQTGRVGYHIGRDRLGVWAVHPRRTLDRAWFTTWKADPDHSHTADLAAELADLILRWSPVLPREWVVTTPPQGASKYQTAGGRYPAGLLAEEVGVRLGLPVQSLLARVGEKRYHHPREAMRAAPFQVTGTAPVALVIDDLSTSGATIHAALQALSLASIPAFGFVLYG